MPGTTILLALSTLALAVPQEIAPSRFDDARITATSLVVEDAPVPASEGEGSAASAALPHEAPGGGLTWKQIAHRVGGALVGGWLGYVGAQVVRSDWDKKTNGSFRHQRYSWAAAGAVVGVVGSHLLRGTQAPRPGGPVVPTAARGAHLGSEEIRSSQARTAYELIYNLRMQWLVTRGANSVAESARGEAKGDFVIKVTPGREKIIVYMDDVRLGGVNEMREIPADFLTWARFLNAQEATLRYGGGHAHGAIQLSTSVSR